MTQSLLTQTLQQQGFQEIQIDDLSLGVLRGFAHYIQSLPRQAFSLDTFKIRMTAKLCHKLYNDGLVHYVQVSAKKQ